MNFDSLFLVVTAVLVTLAVVARLFAPDFFFKYISRTGATTSLNQQRQSNVVAVAALVVVVLIFIHLGSYLITGAPSQVHDAHEGNSRALSLQAWVALVFVSVTGIALILFPGTIIGRLLKARSIFPLADNSSTQSVSVFGRVLGVLFLIGAFVIARRLV